MYLLIDHNNEVVTENGGQNRTFDTIEEAIQYARDLDEIDWLVVKFVCFT